jgi:ABC-2 type transport system ATP-binding protein
MSTPVVEVRNLHKVYGEVVAVDNVSFAVQPGEIFGVLGPNGAGKSTTVECIAGLREADGGHVRVLGVDPQATPELVRQHLGVQFQEAALHDKITVAEALRLFASFYDEPADVEELLDLLDLQGKRDARFVNLSGGQKQRLSIALALVGKPKVAILDELTTGLDPAARRATWDLVEKVRDSGVTILLVTHFMDEAERLCDRLVIIDRGTVVALGSPRELIDSLDEAHVLSIRPADADRAATLAALRALADETRDVESVHADSADIVVTGSPRVRSLVMQALLAAGVVPDDIRAVTRNLEDVFVTITGHAFETDTTEDAPEAVRTPVGAPR